MIKEIFSANRSGAVINSELIALIEKSIQTALEAVSYTQLDVYKRQVRVFGRQIRQTISLGCDEDRSLVEK